MTTNADSIRNGVPFFNARRVNRSLTASAEKRALEWMAARAPRWVTSDQLTILGLGAQIAAGAVLCVIAIQRYALLLVCVCLVLNWLGDSLDGTLARVRRQQRPRYGFYVDHMVDIFGATALMCGLGFSGFLHWQTAMAMLVAFLLLSGESYLATYTLSVLSALAGSVRSHGDSHSADHRKPGAAANPVLHDIRIPDPAVRPGRDHRRRRQCSQWPSW